MKKKGRPSHQKTNKQQIHWSRQRTKKAKQKRKRGTVFKTGLPSPCRQVWHTRIWTAGLMWARYGNHADTFWKLDSCADIFNYLNSYCQLCNACVCVCVCVCVYINIHISNFLLQPWPWAADIKTIHFTTASEIQTMVAFLHLPGRWRRELNNTKLVQFPHWANDSPFQITLKCHFSQYFHF